jgi:hypothetical protein
MSCCEEVHDSEHQALIDRDRYRRVQGTLDARTSAKKYRGRNPD